MPIITISRGSYSRGKEVAEALAKELNYECVSKEIVQEASNEFDISEREIGKALRAAPSLLSHFKKIREPYLTYFKSAFFEHMKRGNIVYHGLAGHFFLQDVSHVVKVRINASMDDRVREEVKREKCREEEAREKIRQDDRARRDWSKQIYGADTWDSRLYDLVLNVDSLSVDDIVGILVKVVKKAQFQESKESLAKLNLLAQIAKAKAILAPLSLHAAVRFSAENNLEIFGTDSVLKRDEVLRGRIADKLKNKLDIGKVHYLDALTKQNDHINTFYNVTSQYQ